MSRSKQILFYELIFCYTGYGKDTILIGNQKEMTDDNCKTLDERQK